MNRILFLVGIFLLLTNCTQNFVSYIKTPTTIPLVSLEDILLESGMMNPSEIAPKEPVINTVYPTGTLAGKRQIEECDAIVTQDLSPHLGDKVI
jgi:hypothetical protein